MQKQINILEKKLNEASNDIERIDIMNDIAYQLLTKDNKRAYELIEEAYQLAKQKEYQTGIANSLLNKGNYLELTGNYKGSSVCLFEALNIFVENGDPLGITKTRESIGSIYYKLGDYPRSLKYHLKCLNYIKKHNENKKEHAEILNNIALVFNQLGDKTKALVYHLKSLKIEENIGNLLGQAVSKNNVGNLYKELGNYHKALEFFEESYNIAKNMDDKQLQITALGNKGVIYETLNKSDRALKSFEDSLKIAKEVNNVFNETILLINISQFYLRKYDFENTFAYLDEALNLATEHNFENTFSNIYWTYSEAYSLKKDYDKALDYYKRYHKHKSKQYNMENSIKIRNLIIQFEVEKIQKTAKRYKRYNMKLKKINKNLKDKFKRKSLTMKKLIQRNEELEQKINIDFLTELYNRRHIEKRLSEEYMRAKRFNHKLTIAMFDIDFFKQINDKISHKMGDEVLKIVANIIGNTCRAIDIVGRYGGDEIIMILPKTDVEQALNLCNRIVSNIKNHDWSKLYPNLNITLSIGLGDNSDTENYEHLFMKADKNLLKAKDNGRDRIEY